MKFQLSREVPPEDMLTILLDSMYMSMPDTPKIRPLTLIDIDETDLSDFQLEEPEMHEPPPQASYPKKKKINKTSHKKKSLRRE